MLPSSIQVPESTLLLAPSIQESDRGSIIFQPSTQVVDCLGGCTIHSCTQVWYLCYYLRYLHVCAFHSGISIPFDVFSIHSSTYLRFDACTTHSSIWHTWHLFQPLKYPIQPGCLYYPYSLYLTHILHFYYQFPGTELISLDFWLSVDTYTIHLSSSQLYDMSLMGTIYTWAWIWVVASTTH